MELLILIMGGYIVYLLLKNRKAGKASIHEPSYMPPRPAQYDRHLDAEINRFAYEIRQEISLAEKVMQASYMEWKLAQEREKRVYYETGAVLPRTAFREKQDAMFQDMERKLETRRQQFLIEHQRAAIEAQQATEMERKTASIIAAVTRLDDDMK